MKQHFLSFAVPFLFIFFTIVPCWGTIDVDIAISTQPNWITQQAADREANEIVSRVRNSVNDIRTFTKDQESQLASWVQAHTSNSQLDILILFGVFPNSIYPSGNKQPDGSIAEKFLEAGNMIINTADYMFYIPYNSEWGIRNMMDLPDVTMWAGGDMKVTSSGSQYLPSLKSYRTTRALDLRKIKSPWTVETVFAKNTEGTLAEPVVVRDTVTGGRLAIFYQLENNDDTPRGEVISEFILNWLPTVAGGTVEPGNGDVTPPVTPGEFVLMGTDPDEDTLGILADIHQVFAASDASQVEFKVTTYRKWGEYAGFCVNIDVDQNPNTGDPVNGADYSVYAYREGGTPFGVLWFYDPGQRDYVNTNATLGGSFDANSDVFRVNVNRSDIGDPDAIDFEVWIMEGDLLYDVAPEVGFYTYELDGTGPVVPPGQGIVIDFEDGSLSDWQVVDEADLNPSNGGTAPSSWQIRDSRMGLDGKALYQGANTYGDRAGTCAIGTFIIYKAQQFTNFILEVDVVTTDNDGMGLVWAYTGTDRHYRAFMLNDSTWPTNPADGRKGPFAKVEKRISNSAPFYQHLSSNSGQAPYPVGEKHHWRLRVDNGVFTFSIDGGSWQLYPQDHSYKTGYVGLMLAAQAGVEFDNFTITPLDGGTTPPEDTTPPVITSGPLVSNVTSSSALVSWSTDEASDSVVQYGKTSSYGLTARGADDVREHSVLLTSLSPDTTYYYRAGSTDSSGNTVWSIQRSFKTSAQGVIPPIGQGGPVIYLPFNEGSGRTAADATSNGNNGTLQGNVTWVNGKYGKAIYINEDSADNMVVVRDSSALDVTDEMTMAAWVYVESIPNLWSVIAMKDGSYMLHIQSHQPNFDVGLVLNVNGSIGAWPDSSVAEVSMNQWHHVVGVYDGDKQYTYIDGELKGTFAKKGTIDVTDSDLVIGHDSRSCCNYRKTAQVIDEFMIFDRALSQAEVTQIMGGTIPSDQPPDGTPSITASPSSVKPGEDISVSYSNAPADPDGWIGIGMYLSGASNQEWLTWRFLLGEESGTLTFKAPAEAGNYEFRMFDNDNYDPSLATSNTVAVSASPVSTRSLVIPEVAAESGESVTVPISIDDASGLAGADITVTYNSSILTVDQVKSTTLSAGINLVPNTNTPGKIILRMAGSAITSGSGALVDMIFTVSSSISEDTETPVSFESAEAYDANGQNIPVSTQNGKVKITSPRKKGDVNNDRKINAADAILALRISAELKPATPEEFWAADMNGDGKVGSNDAILILLEIPKSSAPGREFIASGGRNTRVALGEAHGIAGESITVPLRVDDPDILAGGDISIAYDSSVLRAVSVSSGSDMLMEVNLAEPGLVHIAFANSGGLDDDAIAALEFEIIADDVSPLALRDVELYGGDALPIDVRKIDGQFASWAIPPEHNALLQNFPNPFNPETWIPYQLKEDGEVTIRIYDATGGLVRGLELGHKSAGLYVSRDRSAYWDGRNETGEPVASGVYFYTIQAGEFAATRKMIIAR